MLLVAASQDQEISIQLPEMATRTARTPGRRYVVTGLTVHVELSSAGRGGGGAARSGVGRTKLRNFDLQDGSARKGRCGGSCYHVLDIENLQEESRPGVMRR